MKLLRVALLIFLLMTVGASGAQWRVKYSQQEICAVKGSTVFMNGSYTHPEGLTVTEVFWVLNPVPKQTWADLSKNSAYSGRVEYLGDKRQHFSLKLSDVTKKDEQAYGVRIVTNVADQKVIQIPGIKLRVTELKMETTREVTEGEPAVLTCKTTCSLTDQTWYKNGRPLTAKSIENNQLHLQAVRREDAGSYSCARGPYPAVQLIVGYAPKNVSGSISPSGEVVEGVSVNLTCSSDGNPPVQNYTWFKGLTPVGKGRTYSISNISSEDSGKYTCQSRNKHGVKNSTVVQLNVFYLPKNVSVSISSSGEVVEGSSVTLTCSSDGNPPVQNYTWFKEDGPSPVGSGHSYSPVQSGNYYCKAHNKHGSRTSASVPVTIKEHSVILYAVLGVGLFSVATFSTVSFCIRSRGKRQNMNEEIYANVNLGARPPDDDLSSIPDYENLDASRKEQ